LARSAPAPALSPLRFLRDLVLVLAGMGCALFAVTRWVAMPFAVEGPSMTPTLRDGDRLIVDLLSYRRHPPRIGEVILVLGPGDLPLVKRVGAPPWGTPSDRVWVVGDNPAESSDSREFGALPESRVRGRVTWRYWPPSGWGRIE
jgi:signal peptidase I